MGFDIPVLGELFYVTWPSIAAILSGSESYLSIDRTPKKRLWSAARLLTQIFATELPSKINL